jgi:hypothetical protein
MLLKIVQNIATELKINHKFYIVLSIIGFCIGYIVGFCLSYLEI